MKPLIVLLITFATALFAARIFNAVWNFGFAGNVAMSAMLVFTTIGHFAFPKGMAMMIPQAFPFKTTFVYLTGLIELAAAIGLLFPGTRYFTSWLLIVFFYRRCAR